MLRSSHAVTFCSPLRQDRKDPSAIANTTKDAALFEDNHRSLKNISYFNSPFVFHSQVLVGVNY